MAKKKKGWLWQLLKGGNPFEKIADIIEDLSEVFEEIKEIRADIKKLKSKK